MKYTIYLCLFLLVGSTLLTFLAFKFNLTPASLLILFSLALGIGWLAGGIRQMLEQKKHLKEALDHLSGLNSKKND